MEPASEHPSKSFGDDDSVKQCLEIMEGVLAEQRARGRHLDSKAGTLAGFCATALTLNVVLGRPLLQDELGCIGEFVVELSFFVAAVSLAGAASAAVIAGLRTMGHEDLTETAIDAYSDRPKVVTPPSDLRITWLQTLSVMANSARAAGDEKARWTNRAVVLLLIGVVAIAAQAASLVLSP